MFLYETHMHTAPVSACAASSPAEQVRAYKARGYTGVIITDHFFNGNTGCPAGLSWVEKMAFFFSGYNLAKEEGDLCGLDVFFGLEYNVHGAEFLTYGLSPELVLNNPDMDRFTVAQYSDFVRENGGYLAQAHPYRTAWWIENSGPAAPHLIDGFEVFNASMPKELNNRAQKFARLHNLPMQAGTDSHFADIPFSSGISLKNKAESIFDIIEALKNKDIEMINVPGGKKEWT
jgi:hypothetical protein